MRNLCLHMTCSIFRGDRVDVQLQNLGIQPHLNCRSQCGLGGLRALARKRVRLDENVRKDSAVFGHVGFRSFLRRCGDVVMW